MGRTIQWHRPDSIGMARIINDETEFYVGQNPVYSYKTDRLKNVHRLDDMFSNDKILTRFAFFDLWFIMRRHGANEKTYGPSFAKSATERTRIYFNKSINQIVIHGTKTYSRRSESKERTYPCEWLTRRLEWFLNQSRYVESFKVKRDGFYITIDIKFVDCYSEDRKKMILKRHALTEKTRLEVLTSQLEFAIDNYDSLENLKDRLEKVKKLRDDQIRKVHEIKIN